MLRPYTFRRQNYSFSNQTSLNFLHSILSSFIRKDQRKGSGVCYRKIILNATYYCSSGRGVWENGVFFFEKLLESWLHLDVPFIFQWKSASRRIKSFFHRAARNVLTV